MFPSQFHSLLRISARQQAVKESGCEPVASPDPIEHVQFGSWSHIMLTVDPRHGAPTVPVRRMHLAESRRNNLDLRMLLHHLTDHADKRARIELRFSGYLRSWH